MALVLITFQDNETGVEVTARGTDPGDGELTPAQALAALAMNAACENQTIEGAEEA